MSLAVFAEFYRCSGMDIPSDSPVLVEAGDDYRSWGKFINDGAPTLRLVVGTRVTASPTVGLPLTTNDFHEMVRGETLSNGAVYCIAVSGTGHLDWTIAR